MPSPEALSHFQGVWNKAWAKALLGQGSLEFFSDPEDTEFRSQSRRIVETLPLDPDRTLEIHLKDFPFQAYAPLPQLLHKALTAQTPSQQATFFQFSKIFSRHRPLFRQLLQDKPGPEDPGEDLIEEELAFEIRSFRRALVEFLGQMGPQPLVLFCSGAEYLLPETLELLEMEELITSYPMILFFCLGRDFQNPRGYPQVEQFLRSRISVGRLITLSEGPWSEGTEEVQVPWESLEKLNQYLCFAAAFPWLERLWHQMEAAPKDQTGEDSFRVLTGLTRAALGLEDYDRALFFSQGLTAAADRTQNTQNQISAYLLAALVYRFKNDHETAKRWALKVWDSFWTEADLRDRVRIDSVLFTLNESNVRSMSPALAGCEERLTQGLEALGWKNHLAFVKTRNTRVMEEFWRLGFESAQAHCREGLLLAREVQNTRRRATAHHSLGTLHQAQGNRTVAEKHYRRALKLIEAHAPAFEAARTRNGLGYFYFCQGAYAQAFRCHNGALKELNFSRQYEEILSTLINIARIYLFIRQAPAAVKLLDSVLLILDSLQIPDIPFHPRRSLYAIMGMALIQSGQVSLALEFQRKMHLLPNRGRGLYLSGNQLHFEAQLAAETGDQDRALKLYDLVFEELKKSLPETRHLLLFAFLGFAPYLEKWGNQSRAQQVRREALTLI